MDHDRALQAADAASAAVKSVFQELCNGVTSPRKRTSQWINSFLLALDALLLPIWGKPKEYLDRLESRTYFEVDSYRQPDQNNMPAHETIFCNVLDLHLVRFTGFVRLRFWVRGVSNLIFL
ncbi:hypothetical protein RRG08_065953 [Elysia crispata]|uniref:Uncharacterized protein n=1 Tax=Elysia crispata TaxID=231223 RepID=A0AAE1DFE2_9GAST|nr:hypothetical protein RRG08_065953 [Elysia crispata]